MCATEIKLLLLLLLLVCLGSALFAINKWNLSSPLARPNASPQEIMKVREVIPHTGPIPIVIPLKEARNSFSFFQSNKHILSLDTVRVIILRRNLARVLSTHRRFLTLYFPPK